MNFLLSNEHETQNCVQSVMQRPVVVIRGGPEKFRNFDTRKASTYLLTSSIDLENTLDRWSQSDFFNPRAKFWILNTTPTRQFFKILAKFYIVDVRVVTTTSQVYTYDPYKFQSVSNPDTNPIHLGGCQNPDQHSQNLPKFWQNTTLKIITKCMTPYVNCVRRIAGIEPAIFTLIQRKLKFESRYVIDNSSTFGLVKKNGTYSASFGLLQRHQAHMAMGGFRTIGSTQYRDFDYATNHLEDKLVWVVPQALPLVHWMRIIKTFHWKFWLLLTIATVLVSKILEQARRLRHEPSKIFADFALGTTFRLLVGENLKKTPSTTLVRVIFIFWIYFCMTFNITFNSDLVNVFFANFMSYQIDSFDEIVRSRLHVGLTDDVMNLLQGDQDWSLLTAKKHVLTCPFGTSCLNRTIFQRDLVCCWAERSIKYRMATSYQTGVHLIDDHLLYFYVVFYFVKGYPMVPGINQVINELKSAGLVQYIVARSDQNRPQKVELGTQVLTFKRLEGPFYFLIFGWGVSFVVFLGEVFQHSKQNQ